MHYEIQPNPRHETYTNTAFLEQMAAYSPTSIVLMVTVHDLVDPTKPLTLENFGIPPHHFRLLDRVVFARNGSTIDEVLWEKPVNS